MQYYIVRVYREEADNPNALVGIVEEVEKHDKLAFTSLGELWAILNPAKKKEAGKDKNRGDRGRIKLAVKLS